MKQQSILLVENDTAFARTLAQALKLGSESNYRVSICGSAKEAYQFLESDQIDLLISKCGLPDEEGLSLLSNAREHYPEILTLLIIEADYYELNCHEPLVSHGYLVKPFDMLDLILMVQQVLTSQETPRQIDIWVEENELDRQFTILILEDDAGLRTIYSRALHKSDCYLIDEASTLDEARAMLNTRDYDILISDMRIGRYRATDILDEYNDRFKTYGTKVVMCSAFGQYRNLPTRVDHFLEKPISLERLVNLVSLLTETGAVGPC